MKIVPIRSMPSPNRVGSCLWKMIIILIRGHNKEYFLQESHCKYRNSLLCTVFYEYINKIYNVQLAKKLNVDKRNAVHAELITHGQHELCTLPLIACQETGSDIYSYFRTHFFNHFSNILEKEILNRKYVIPKNWEKRICIHLRMDDCITGQHSVDYDGRTSHNYFSNKIGNEPIEVDENISPGPINETRPSTFDIEDYKAFFKNCGVRIIGRGLSCYQSPIPYNRMEKLISNLRTKYPNHEIVIVASPKHAKENNSDINLDYDNCIRSSDPDEDLIHLIYNDILVCSRSTYSMVAAFFHKGSNIIFAQWGYTGGAGLGSKCDKTKYELYY